MAYRVPIFNLYRATPVAGISQSSGGTPWSSDSRTRTVVPISDRRRVTFGIVADNVQYDTPFRGRVRAGQTTNQNVLLNPQNLNDGRIHRVRVAWHDQGRAPSLPKNFGAWDQAGPARPILRNYIMNLRRVVGGSNQIKEGMHTIPGIPTRTLPGKPRQTTTQQYRLTVPRYVGQSYSDTTEVLG